MRHNIIILLAVSSTRYEREKLCRSINYTFPVKIIDFYLRNVPPPREVCAAEDRLLNIGTVRWTAFLPMVT